jgi:FtsP/CotA-like multicopper oxidase with cupredoxin domain
METPRPGNMNRRELLKLGGGLLIASAGSLRATVEGAAGGAMQAPLGPCNDGGPLYSELFPTSPLILEPFTQELPNPEAMKPSNPNDWVAPQGATNWARPSRYQQDCDFTPHQLWPSDIPLKKGTYPEPLYYRIKLQLGQHRFTTSKVLPIAADGTVVSNPFTGQQGPQALPPSTIYGFNGTFPGPLIYARYEQPSCLRFENELDKNPLSLERNDFGSPEWGFLTHLHNGHTACESDGNPNHRPTGYLPGQWCDNLYLNYPPNNDPGEKQSFLWFHDHYMHHTGADVYKGMVGLYYLYDPVLDPGDERFGLRLPGVPLLDGGRVKQTRYDIPLAFFDCRLDDGVTGHRDAHNGCGETHPEWWGQTFFRHYPNHGFVGDVFTTNCVAYPVLRVKRRKYRLRLLGASISRIYEFSFMSSTDGPKDARFKADGREESNPNKRQGQYRIRDGQQCLQFHEIAVDGGLLPFALLRNSVEIWPAKRRELVVDFSRYLDGTPTSKDDVIWLVNTYQMTNGRKRTESTQVLDDGSVVADPDFEPGFCVPMVKIIIESDQMELDDSLTPSNLRPLPVINMRKLKDLPTRRFELQRSGALGGETEWLINGQEFHPGHNLAFPKRAMPEVWTLKNGGGGWVHPLHFHFEEHRVISRNGIYTPLDPKHPDDNAREDVIALEPGRKDVSSRRWPTPKRCAWSSPRYWRSHLIRRCGFS